MKTVITTNGANVIDKYKRLLKKLPGAQDRALDILADEAIVLYKKTTRTWKHKPVFLKRRRSRGVEVYTTDDIYKWIDRGTRPHIIEAKNAPMLVFRGPYRAATKIRVIGSINAMTGNNWARKFSVRHPGTKARHFTDEITKRINKRAGAVMTKEIKKTINAEGFGL